MIWQDGKISEGTLSKYPPENKKGWVYEVLRIIDGAPVFAPEHLSRYEEALKATNTIVLYSRIQLTIAFFNVISENNITEGNIRLQTEIGTGLSQIGFIPHRYPSADDYTNGVKAATVNLNRSIPNIKTWNESIRVFCDEFIRANNLFEAILVNDEGFLTEGSRSNIFGVKDSVLITPPVKTVLPGITRQIILKTAKENSIPVLEENIHRKDLINFQSFFISGTSPGILPIKSIDDIKFNCKSAICESLNTAYNTEVKNSISKAKKIKPL